MRLIRFYWFYYTKWRESNHSFIESITPQCFPPYNQYPIKVNKSTDNPLQHRTRFTVLLDKDYYAPYMLLKRLLQGRLGDIPVLKELYNLLSCSPAVTYVLYFIRVDYSRNSFKRGTFIKGIHSTLEILNLCRQLFYY